MTIRIEICAAWPDRCLRQSLELPEGASLMTVREHAGLSEPLRDAWAQAAAVSVYGVSKPLREPLMDGDRIELLRPLAADPKEARRQLARLKGLDAAAPRRRRDGGQGRSV